MIKAAKMEDLLTVTKLAYSLWPDNIFNDLKKEMEETVSDKNAVIALYFINENPVGFAQGQLRNDYVEGTDSNPVGYLEGIYLDAKYRKQGIAKELLRYCEIWVKENGCSEFGSDCELDNNESLNFHLRVGFKEVNRIICFSKKL